MTQQFFYKAQKDPIHPHYIEKPHNKEKITMLQLHVKGIDGKTYTVNLEGADPLVSNTGNYIISS